MEPGRELDALIAEKVMGLSLMEEDAHETWVPIEPEHYSTDIAAAWEVMDRLKASLTSTEDHGEPGGWEICITFNDKDGPPTEARGTGDTVPHAICLLALKLLDNPA